MENEPTSDPEPVADVELSLAEHEAQFGSADKRPQPDPEPEPEEDARRPPRERDDQGKFVKPEPAKPEKHGGRPALVAKERIDDLTKHWRTAEAERDAARAEVEALKARTTASVPAHPAAAPVQPAAADVSREKTAVKPKIDDFQEYGDYVEALADWKIGEARRQDRETAHKEAETEREWTAWRAQIELGKAEFPDFEEVALQGPTDIPQGQLIDRWIRENKNGRRVLYWLQKEPQELRRILALELFDQAEALTLLGQRTGQPSREPAVRTGAAATTPRAPAPRPVTPVRTSAMSAADEPPDPEHASLAEFEKFYYRDRR